MQKKKGYWISPHPHFESVYETLTQEEAEEKLTIDWQLHIGIDDKNVYAELEDEADYLKVGEYVYKDDMLTVTLNRAHYWGDDPLRVGCIYEQLLLSEISSILDYCNFFDFDNYRIETSTVEQTLDFYDENGHHFASLTDADAYDQMHYKLLAGGDPVADLWEYTEDEEEDDD